MGRNDGAAHDTVATRFTRRTLLGSAGVFVLLAGCTGDDDGGDDSTPDGDSEPTETSSTDTPDTTEQSTNTTGTESAVESMCQVTQESVEQLSIVGCQSEGEDGNLVVDLRVRNDGQQETDLLEYELTVTPYDATDASDSNDIGSGGLSITYTSDSVVQPGDTAPAIVKVGLVDSASPSDVRLYTITIECDTFSDGSYCE